MREKTDHFMFNMQGGGVYDLGYELIVKLLIYCIVDLVFCQIADFK